MITIEETQRNFLLDQWAILSSYGTWLSKAIQLDFGKYRKGKKTKIFPTTVKHFNKSFKMIFYSVIIGFVLSVIVFRLSFYQYIKRFLIDPVLSISFLHLTILIILFRGFVVSQGATPKGVFDDLVVCLIMVLSNGMLYDYFSLLRDEHNLILNKDYAIFAKHSGFQKYIFASKELIISFIYITVSRIPILFASMTILEVLSKGKYWAIGYDIWFYLYLKTNYAAFFASTFVTIMFFTLLYFIAEHLKMVLSPKLNKT